MDKARYARLVDGETKLMGVIGHGIAYTQSPRLHNYAANQLGKNVAYLPIDIPADEVRAFLDAAWSMGAVGFSVTKPHKGLVASLLPKTKLASVNTLFRGKTWWEGASTDGDGFVAGLQRIQVDVGQLEHVVVIGAGGATTSLFEAFGRHAKQKPGLAVLRRSDQNDAALKKVLPKGWAPEFLPLDRRTLAGALAGKGAETLLIQASSAPQNGDDLGELVPALDGYAGAVADLVYGKPSALYSAALAKDLVCQDGEAMLIEQARLAQNLWWGRALPYDEMAMALRGK